MREIKFRIWNRIGNCIHDWNEIVEKNKIHLLSNQQYSYPVMQYTGMKDVNGVEIYEGDVVQVAGTGIAEVKICPAYGVVFSDKDGFERPYIDCVSEGDFPAIAGNIYQNPELLNG